MRLTFLGGADEVGASSTLIEIGGKTLLVDAGIRISPRTSRGIQNDQLPHLAPVSEAGGPDFILVTHAHTDHTGALPLVVEQYPHVPVIATRPTVDLVRVLQNDAQRIMKSRQDAEGELPLFDEIAVGRLMDAFQQVDFGQALRLGDGLQVTYHPAGHIAGAAMLVFESEDGTLVMSGDLSLNDQRAVVSAAPPRIKADALVLESTYGGRQHANRKAEEMRLIETLKTITEGGGRVLIPAFALGRAQEIIQIILAYRDQIDVPVYVDGMVRSVCTAYTGFADLLPQTTTRAAREEPLFFRGKIKPIRSGAHREEIARSDTPAIVVASSGMLTGGASVVYARHFAADPASAILLTGYQDEEAPGRFLQKLLQDRAAGDEPVLRLGDSSVPVRCQLGVYSLSAHADEGELVSIAEAFDAGEIMLVHGDPSARHSLATRLRQRGRRVLLPKIAQTETFSFARKPWAIGRVASGHETQPLDPRALWESLKDQAGNYFSAQEIARMWWGDGDRADEARDMLSREPFYFAADWRSRSSFQVRSEQQAARVQRQHAIMLANPDIVGKLIVMRNSNDQPRLAVVRAASIDGFEGEVVGTRGRQHPADALLWVIGPWDGYGDEGSIRNQLRTLMQKGQTLQDILLPLTNRQQLVEAGQPVNPPDLLPDMLPEDVTEQEALVGIVLALARDGAQLEQGGLVPRRASHTGPVEQNEAREIAFTTIPAESRLRKVGMDVHRKRLTLTFDFPDSASRHYAAAIEQVADLTGWEVIVKPGVNQQALGAALDELMPPAAYIAKGPSYFMDRREVSVDIDGLADATDLANQFRELTGFRLRLNEKGDDAGPASPVAAQPASGREPIEINAAYGLIRAALEPFGLYKTSLKQGYIVLSFISPQVGERHAETIRRLAEQTGYMLTIHPHPNQQQILQIASRLAREAGWSVRKGPGIHVDRAEVSFTLADTPDDDVLAAAAEEFEDTTGYRMIVTS
jgi:Cft2 family RNA processing exonuclease